MSDALRVESAAGGIRLSGRLGYGNAGADFTRVVSAVPRGLNVAADVSALEQADSATLAVLLACAAHAAAGGGAFTVRGASAGLRALARLGEVEGLLGIA